VREIWIYSIRSGAVVDECKRGGNYVVNSCFFSRFTKLYPLVSAFRIELFVNRKTCKPCKDLGSFYG
jgi:hypothetical protein